MFSKFVPRDLKGQQSGTSTGRAMGPRKLLCRPSRSHYAAPRGPCAARKGSTAVHGAAPWGPWGHTLTPKFRCFLGPSDQKKLYHTPLLSKIWSLGEKIDVWKRVDPPSPCENLSLFFFQMKEGFPRWYNCFWGRIPLRRLVRTWDFNCSKVPLMFFLCCVSVLTW